MIKLYIIPGFGETTRSKGYKKIIDSAHVLHFKVIPIYIIWGKTVATDWLKQLRSVLMSHHETMSTPPILLGFSFGAYLAILLAKEIKFKKLILCSLSPYFRDDIQHLPQFAHKMLGKRRIKDFQKYPFPKDILTPAVFFVGGKDSPLVIQRTHKAYKTWKGKKQLEVIQNAEHSIDNKLYLAAIQKQLKNLR